MCEGGGGVGVVRVLYSDCVIVQPKHCDVCQRKRVRVFILCVSERETHTQTTV